MRTEYMIREDQSNKLIFVQILPTTSIEKSIGTVNENLNFDIRVLCLPSV